MANKILLIDDEVNLIDPVAYNLKSSPRHSLMADKTGVISPKSALVPDI